MTETTDKSQPPEFGENGAVLNAPTRSDEMRAEYLGLNESPKPKDLSVLSKLIFTFAILLSAYVAGIEHPITSDPSTIDNLSLLVIILLFLGLSIDRIIDKIKKLVMHSD